MNPRSLVSTAHAIRAKDGAGALSRSVMLGAVLAGLSGLHWVAHAQTATEPAQGDCRAANVQRTDELLQALSAARRQRSSLSFVMQLAPIEAQLKFLKAAQQGPSGAATDCQSVASQIEAARGRLSQVVPDLQKPSPALQPAATAPGAAIAPAVAPATMAATDGACTADNEQTRADLAQRFVHFMQLARVPPDGLSPYQSFGRRLAGLDVDMSARPDDCNGHRAALAQSNTELQQLMAMEAQMSPAAGGTPAGSGDRPLDGTMPLLSNPSTERCIADLRLGFRDMQQAATDLLMTLPDGNGRTQARQLVNRVTRQQIETFGRSPLSSEACELSRRSLGEVRASVATLRSGATEAAASPLSPIQPAAGQQPQWLTVAPVQPQQQPAAQNQAAANGNAYLDCMVNNRRLYADLEREGNALKASGRMSPAWPAAFDRDLAVYREWLRKGVHPIQCGVLANQLTNHLGLVRQEAAAPVAPSAPQAVAVPAAPHQPAVGGPAAAAPGQVATATPPAARSKLPPPTVQPTPAKPTAAAAQPTIQRAQAAPAPSPAPSPPPAQAQRPRQPDPSQKCKQEGEKMSAIDRKRCTGSAA